MLICKWCGEKLVKINGIYCDNTLVFPQYCRNIVDENDDVIEYGKKHEPIKDNDKE